MEKSKVINGITVYWDDDEIGDMKNIKNAVYKLVFDNLQVYYGSCRNLYKRIKSHCSHVNSYRSRNLYDVMSNRRKVKVCLIGTYDTIDEAQYVESYIINGMAKKIYDRSRVPGSFREVVGGVMLNRNLYTTSY